MTAPPVPPDGAERWAGSQSCEVPFVLLQPLVQCPGLGVEPQAQFDVAVGFQGIETEHVGQVLGAGEAKLLVVLGAYLEAEGSLLGSIGICSTLTTLLTPQFLPWSPLSSPENQSIIKMKRQKPLF